MGNFIPYRLEENEVISKLIDMINRPGKDSDLGIFGYALFRRFDHEDFRDYKGLYIGQCLTRKELGLPGEGQKPGDIDILIIPYKENAILYDRAAAYEVKVVRPTRERMNKRPNSFGVKQIMGYVEDGFPFVSALHICMTEPLKGRELVKMPFMLCSIGDGNGEKMPKDAPPLEAYEMTEHDWFPHYAADNHMRRMISAGIPKFVGLDVVSWNLSEDGHLITSRSFEYHDFEGCFWNPKRKHETVDLIATHLQMHPERYHNIPIVRHPSKWERKSEITEGMDSFEPDTDEEGNEIEVKEETPFSVQSLFEVTKSISVPVTKLHDVTCCFPVTGHGMTDGTKKSIPDGSYILVKDLGLPAFEDIPCFQPVALVRNKNGKLQNVVGIVSKKHEESKVLRFSFYNLKYPETWMRYSTIKQVFEVVDVLDPATINFQEPLE